MIIKTDAVQITIDGQDILLRDTPVIPEANKSYTSSTLNSYKKLLTNIASKISEATDNGAFKAVINRVDVCTYPWDLVESVLISKGYKVTIVNGYIDNSSLKDVAIEWQEKRKS